MSFGPRSAIFIVLVIVCPLSAYANSRPVSCKNEISVAITAIATGAISGKVTRTDGTTAILGAAVKAYQGTSIVGAATSNATGDYSIGGLNTGTYTIEISAAGYETVTQSGISVTDGATTTLNINLPVPINYVYDDLGRLVATIDKDGNAATYAYDAVGNLLSISRQVPSQVSIIQFSPGSGPVGSLVTIYGAGFSATAGQNTVTFNGVAASVTASSTNLIVTSVPAGATTGSISVTSPVGSVTSATSFTVTSGTAGAPTISDFTPAIGVPGTSVTINGTNFNAVAANNRPSFNVVNATVTSSTTTSIATTVPQSGSGRIAVTTPAGKATSTADFLVPPSPYTAADVVTTGRMTIGGGSNSVSVNTAGKIGLRLFDGNQGQRIYLDITGVSAQSNAYVNIYNPDGTLLTSVTISFSNANRIDATVLPSTGTYSIMLAPWATGTAAATFTLYDVAPDFTSTISPSGSSVTATLTTPGQNARLTFAGATGQIISLRVTGVTIGSTTTVYIFNPNGTTLLSFTINSSSGGWLDATTLPSPGTYTILADPTTTNTGNATLALYNVVHIAGSITPGGSSVPVVINTPGQNASYTFSGAVGQQISLNVTSVTVAGGTVYIKKPDGTTLTSAGFGTSGVFIDNTTLPVAGTYTVFVDPSVYNTGNLTLNLYNTADFTGTISVGGSPVTVNITSPGQNARLTFSSSAGQKISINVTAVSITGSSTLSLLKPDGSSFGSWSFGSGGVFIDTQTLPVAGTYTIVVNPQVTGTGNATLTLNDCTDVTGAVSPGGSSVAVTIPTQGQSASITFSGVANQRVSLNMTSITIFSSYVDFYKPDGSVLGSSTLVSNVSSAFIDPRTLPVNGTYTILINPNNTNTGSMTLTLYDVPADPTGSITIGGSALGVTTSVPGQNATVTFSGTSGQQVTVHVTGNTMGSVTVKLLKPDGTTLTTTTSSSASFNLATQTLSVTGTFSITIDPSGANVGSMNVSVTSP